jgi:hypothetical protein
VRAGDVVALEHLVEAEHRTLDRADGVGARGRHADEGRHVLADPPRVEDRGVAADHTGLLELVDPLEHRGRRQPDLLADRGERLLAVLLEQLEDRNVRGIELQVVAAEFH